MPWLGHAPDAPDTHKMWADRDSAMEAALRASGWRHEVPAPGSDEPPVNEPPAELAAADQPPVVELPAPEPRKRGGRG
ncbi:hypothetical protein SAMN05216188_11856 [Lentzea xinjiangensis]|uniref:Uncharacterized protein n=1 Tax=Lentzea xinjiangensis TaxID=402600 RepID=A0A1H9TDW1_9PSEU|nr:hypothetical protein SAMN05216188_11856 [Lentzea xinjiangensis]